MRTVRSISACVFTIALCVGLAACGTTKEDPSSAEGASSGHATTQSKEKSMSEPAEPTELLDEQSAAPKDEGWSDAEQQVDPSNDGEDQVLTDIRVGSHDDFDRLVIELSGDGTPGWFANWATRATEQGRGQDLDIDGPAFLDLKILWVAWQLDEKQKELEYTGPKLLQSGGIRAHYDSVFEGEAHLVVGMDEKRPFRIFTMSNPSRVVIDVQK